MATPTKRKYMTTTLLNTPSAVITQGAIQPSKPAVCSNSVAVKTELNDNNKQLSVSQIATSRVGYTELISIKQFRSAYLHTIKSINELIEYNTSNTIQYTNTASIDYNRLFDCNDMNIQSPTDVIHTAVNDEVQRIADLEIQYKHSNELMKIELQQMEQEQLVQQQQQVLEIAQAIHDKEPSLITNDNQHNSNNNNHTDSTTTQHTIDTAEHTDGHATDTTQQRTPTLDSIETTNNNNSTNNENEKTMHTGKKKRRKQSKPDSHTHSVTDHSMSSSDDDRYDFTEDADFGLHIPLYAELQNSLQPLIEQRKYNTKLSNNKFRTNIKDNNNVINRDMIHNDIQKTINQAKLYNIDTDVAVSDNEVLLHVEIYHTSTPGKKINEFIVLGSQPLTTLRDKIYCINNTNQYNIDLNSHHQLNNTNQIDTYSSYFFIENIFYDDLRDERAIRLSDNIIEWQQTDAKQLTNQHIQRYTQSTMHTTSFADLSIRLGTHYVYVHSGDCTHTIIFTQCRMKNSSDYSNALAYPIKYKQSRFNRHKCNICDVSIANYIVFNDLLSNVNPTYICQLCHNNLHLDKNGQLLYTDYQIYPYLHS